jgi:hypothetical protein
MRRRSKKLGDPTRRGMEVERFRFGRFAEPLDEAADDEDEDEDDEEEDESESDDSESEEELE